MTHPQLRQPASVGRPAAASASDGVAPLVWFARTVRAWEAEILAFHTSGG